MGINIADSASAASAQSGDGGVAITSALQAQLDSTQGSAMEALFGYLGLGLNTNVLA